jgi:Phage portal protein
MSGANLISTMTTTKATTTRQKKFGQPTILASVEISPKDTFLISQDIFNEPSRERLQRRGDQWVRIFEQRDEFLKGLIACVNNSPTLRRIISDKVSMIVGDGYIPIKGKSSSLLATTQKPTQITGQQLEDIETAIEKVNEHGQTLADVNAVGAYDFEAFGNAIFELVRGRVGVTQFCDIYNVDLYNVGIRRAGLDQIIRSYGIYDNWEEMPLSSDGTGYIDKGFREIAAYPNWTQMEDGTERSIIHIKNYCAGYTYWGLPDWISARLWAELEYQIQRFNVSKLYNSFIPSGLLQLFGSVSPAEAKKLVERIEKKFTGTGNNHKMVVQVLRDEKLKANWVPMDRQHDGEFLQLQQSAAENIVTASGWSAALAGISTPGKLGSNQEIRSETEKVQSTIIKPRQNMICNRVINPYLLELSASVKALKGVQFGIVNTMPVSFLGEISPETNLTRDEKRELLGYPPDENQQPEPVTGNQQADGAANPTP